MRIKITTAFEDLQEEDESKRLRLVNAEITVTRERGEELCGLGLAIDITPPADAPDKQTTKN